MRDVQMVLCAKVQDAEYAMFQRVGMTARPRNLTPESAQRLMWALYKFAEFSKVDRVESYPTPFRNAGLPHAAWVQRRLSRNAENQSRGEVRG
jgi:hypothetical protein